MESLQGVGTSYVLYDALLSPPPMKQWDQQGDVLAAAQSYASVLSLEDTLC